VPNPIRHRRELRRAATEAERVLWYHLRDRRLAGFKFRRQHCLRPFILDFFCPEAFLAVEVDGGQHFESSAKGYDERRSEFLRTYGVRVLRFSNDQVIRERSAVLKAIARSLGVEV
jgi:adenine-specific DNA-methyltransferase